MSLRRLRATHLIALLRRRTTTCNLGLHVGPILDVLPEVADVAAELLVRLKAEGDDGDKAEGEPFPALGRARGEVAAVLALDGHVFGAFEARGEGCVGC